MKKNKLIPIILTIANFIICLYLLIFLTPSKVPIFSGTKDEYILICSKWVMLVGAILPFIFLFFALKTKDNILKLIFTETIVFIVYENMLAFSLFCTETSFILGETSKIPLSLAIFLPISLSIFVYGAIIKNISYKNKLGINSKNIQTTEFIWNQSHITASYHFRLAGLILFVISIVFIFLHYPLIELTLFVVGLAIPRIVVEIQAKQMTNKYNDMKKKQDHLKEKTTKK